MLFSGKISNSIIGYLQHSAVQSGKNCELDSFLEIADLPQEFMHDPTCWLDAGKVEKFLEQIVNHCEKHANTENIIEQAGHQASELKTWGVLDGVLRMIEKPQDIYVNPQRFISYFISPAPPIANIKRGESFIEFDVPIAYEEFPYVVTYLRSAIEAVPLFMGAEMADVKWSGNQIRITWSQSQTMFGGEQNLERRQMAPEVMQNLISTLEKTEQALLEKSRELEKIKAENALAALSQPINIDELTMSPKMAHKVQDQIHKLQDYFTRSEQLVTLLIGQDRQSPQVREAMRRVNWDFVKSSFPEITKEILESVLSKSSIIENTRSAANEAAAANLKSSRSSHVQNPEGPSA